MQSTTQPQGKPQPWPMPNAHDQLFVHLLTVMNPYTSPHLLQVMHFNCFASVFSDLALVLKCHEWINNKDANKYLFESLTLLFLYSHLFRDNARACDYAVCMFYQCPSGKPCQLFWIWLCCSLATLCSYLSVSAAQCYQADNAGKTLTDKLVKTFCKVS